LLALAVGAAGVSERPLVANVESANESSAQHVVASGDSLGAIALQYGVTAERLATLNGIANPDSLEVGQRLQLPPGSSPRSAGAVGGASESARTGSAGGQGAGGTSAAGGEYVVQAGDTLGGVARTLGVAASALAEANGIDDPNRLIAGRRLVVPAGARAADGSPGGAGAPGNASGAGSAGSPATSIPPAATAGQAPAGSAEAAAARPTGTPADVSALLDRLAGTYGVDPTLVKAVAWPMSSGRPLARERVGLGGLQVTPATLEFVEQQLVKRAFDRASLADHAEAGVAYLVHMLKWGGEEPKGLAAFIQGPGSVRGQGIRPATEQQVAATLAARDRLRASGDAPSSAAQPQSAPAAQADLARRAAAPQPMTAAAVSTTPLQARVLAVARAVGGPQARIGVAGYDTVSGQRIQLAADQAFPATSVGKLALLVEAYRQSEAGTRPLTAERRAQLEQMIVASDNDAANKAIEELGLRNVNTNLQALGLAATRLVNPFGTTRPAAGAMNVSTPNDMARLLELLADERLVSPAASREMRALLQRTVDSSKLRRGVPAGARVAHKSGWFGDVANDVGIVTQGGFTYVLAVFTEGIDDPETANQTIAAIAKTVQETWGPR